MECDICANFHASENTFLCPACARAALYPHRITQARLLLDKEKLRRRVEAVLDSRDTVPPTDDAPTKSGNEDADASSKWAHESNLADIYKSQERLDDILQRSKHLKTQIEEYKAQIEQRKAEAAHREQSTSAASNQLAKLNPSLLETNKRSIRRKGQRRQDLAKDITAARTVLCREAAQLSGLQRYQRMSPEGVTQEHFMLNGLPIVDLRDLNDVPPKQINASLANVARLLVQTCYYLGVRLPAEITLPKENYFHATIHSPYYSYLPRTNETSIPGLTSSNSSPSASRTIDHQAQSSAQKLRPLFLHKKLSVLMREGSTDHGYFVEGVSYLAWNVAWLCRMQGLAIANNDWEEICAMGRNLWLLLIDETTLAQKQEQEARSKTARKTITTTAAQTAERPKLDRTASTTATPSVFGVRSHGTSGAEVHSDSMDTPPGAAALNTVDVTPRSWRFASPLRLIDKLKAHLVNDASGAEWEVLSSGEIEGWAAAPSKAKVDEEPVVVATSKAGTPNTPTDARLPQQKRLHDLSNGILTANHPSAKETTSHEPGIITHRTRVVSGNDTSTDHEGAQSDANSSTRPKGTSGWTKLKSRSSSTPQGTDQMK